MKDDVECEESDRADTRFELTRPPGADLSTLYDLCTSCGDCVAVCPSDLIALDADGFPYLSDLTSCGCCGLCADVCAMGAIEFNAATLAGLGRTLATEREMSARLLLK